MEFIISKNARIVVASLIIVTALLLALNVVPCNLVVAGMLIALYCNIVIPEYCHNAQPEPTDSVKA